MPTEPAGPHTSNNCSLGAAVGVADLTVSSLSVSDSTVATGASFTLNATVENQGVGTVVATTLRYYRLTYSFAYTSLDIEVGTDSVVSLAASATSPESISLTAPDSAGTYYYGACVDSVSTEADTSNNCSTVVTVTVGRPDLIVSAFSVSDSTVGIGASIALNATVRNQGFATANKTFLIYYRSSDSTISSSDTELHVTVNGTRIVSLGSGGSSEQTMHTDVPGSTGTYYYGACVISVPTESDTSNNCSTAVAVAVTVARPDLIVSSFSVSNLDVLPGASFALNATVENQGTVSTGAATTLRYYRSTNSTISSSDTQVGTDFVGSLAASATGPESISLTAPSSAGTYYYGACVVSVSTESNTGNNCSSAVAVTVGVPDLIVSAFSVSNLNVPTGASLTLNATVLNQGTGGASATTLRYYRAPRVSGVSITSSDYTQIGTDGVTSLAASATSSESISLTAPSSAGTYYYIACVDSVYGESDTSNRCSDGVDVKVGKPDLGITSFTWESFVGTGGSFPFYYPVTKLRLSVSIKNFGNVASGPFQVNYLRRPAYLPHHSNQGSLDAGYTRHTGTTLSYPHTGTYYVCVVDVPGETNEFNNCSGDISYGF